MEKIILEVTTDGSGDGTAISDLSKIGFLHEVEWVVGDFVTGVDFTLSVTGTPSGVDKTLLAVTNANANKVYLPRTLEHNGTGGDLATYDKHYIHGKLKLVVAQGGAAKTGRVFIRLKKE